MKEENMRSQVKTIMLDTGLNTTAHGISNIILNTGLIFKLMWIGCSLGSCAGCSIFLYRTVIDYMSYEVVTTIREFGETPSPFPTVSLCNTNLVTNQQGLDYIHQKMISDLRLLNLTVGLHDYIR